MKIAVGMFYHEANSFNPSMLKKEDMVFCEGKEVLDRLFATEVFEKEKVELVPLIYAVALPNGIIEKQAYDFYANKILDILEKNKDVDGIFLHLHGSMEVEGLGSGEYDLLKNIRKIVGANTVIGIGLDFHANTDERFPPLVNVIRNYRTVPHSDQDVMEKCVATKIIDMIKNNKKITPQFEKLPYAVHPEKALGATWPLNEIFKKLDELEELEQIAVASVGIGMIWCDCATLATNVTVTPSEEKYTEFARKTAKELADWIYSLRDSFEFEQLPLVPHEAARYAAEYNHGAPVYVSDSGDNTTGGAVGDHTILLREFLNLRNFYGKKVLVTAVWDEVAVSHCMNCNEGELVTVSVGKNYDNNTKAVEVTGVLKKKGKLLGYMGCETDAVGTCVTISTDHVDFCIISRPGSFISKAHFGSSGAGLNMDDYQVIVVKQGYLFSELRALASLAILALTPGATHQIVETLEYKNITPPIYPLSYTGK